MGNHARPCFGWHCLTPAEHFGIIFSAIVIFIVLALAWMYYLGKVANSKKERNSVVLPGGRRQPRNRNMLPGIALGQLPVAQANPSQPVQVVYQPVVYNTGLQNYPQAQPFPVATRHHHHHHGAAQTSLYLPQPRTDNASAQLSQPDLFRDRNHMPVSGSWSQRFRRLFNLPLGRASTVTSTTSVRSHTQEGLDVDNQGPQFDGDSQPASEMSLDRSHDANPESPFQSLPNDSRPLVNHSKNVSSHLSLHTDVATVHSDDYYCTKAQRSQEQSCNDMISVPSVSSLSLGQNSNGIPVPCSPISSRSGSTRHRVFSNEAKQQGRFQGSATEQPGKGGSNEPRRSRHTERERARMDWDRRDSTSSNSGSHSNPDVPMALDQGRLTTRGV